MVAVTIAGSFRAVSSECYSFLVGLQSWYLAHRHRVDLLAGSPRYWKYLGSPLGVDLAIHWRCDVALCMSLSGVPDETASAIDSANLHSQWIAVLWMSEMLSQKQVLTQSTTSRTAHEGTTIPRPGSESMDRKTSLYDLE
jgi:hypothetical protein